MKSKPSGLTRRELAAGAVAASALSPSKRAKAETVIDDATLSNQLDPVRWTLDRYKQAPLKLTFKATTRPRAEAWQKELRAKVAELLGGFPAKTPLVARSLGVSERPAFRRERFVFESRPGMMVSAYLLTPSKSTGPLPVVICVPGHGRGADDLVGLDEQGKERTERVKYQFDFALQVVEQGMAAVAIEPMGFGCRRDPIAKKKGAGVSSCQPTAGAALLFGETMIGWRVYDVMRTIDWLETRKEVDAKRVGLMGISGGGTITTFGAALEPRIKAAFISGYLNTFRDSIVSLSHCIDNYVPGILNWAEMYDVAGLIAPRPLFVESGTRDPIFPIGASKDSVARVRKVYEVFGAASAVGHEIFEGEHLFHGAQGVPFLAKALRAL
jgi:dienelactone hydrolase